MGNKLYVRFNQFNWRNYNIKQIKNYRDKKYFNYTNLSLFRINNYFCYINVNAREFLIFDKKLKI